MCLTIYNRHTNQEIETPPQLRALLGVDKLPLSEGYKTIEDDCCLCQVDVDIALIGAGIEFEDDCGMQYIIDYDGLSTY